MVVSLKRFPGLGVWQVGRWWNQSSTGEILKGGPNSIHSPLAFFSVLINSL